MANKSHLYIVDDDTAQVTPTGFNGGEPPMSHLEKRVEKLEEQYLKIYTDLEIIKSNYATKSDVSDAISLQTKWIAGTIIGALVLGIGAMSAILKWLIV
ncbi:hypothetical protein [Haemophilus haemolyticus]|uniref:hypothetical protein n=1 Tax=Haemophilus haemolyticus TaxID=726 RepID=UPI0019570A59|nr:hypothetical protein [Haemophilus haemolyticus]